MGYKVWFVDKVEGTKIKCVYINHARCVLYPKVTSTISLSGLWFLGHFGCRMLDIVPFSVNDVNLKIIF